MFNAYRQKGIVVCNIYYSATRLPLSVCVCIAEAIRALCLFFVLVC